MANANTEITIEGVHTAILDAIRENFPSLVTVDAYLLDRQNLPAPACLLELSELEATADAADPGTEQLAVTARFSALLAIGFRQGRASPKLEIRKLAASMLAFLRLQRFGLPIGPAQIAGAYPDSFDPDLDQYECWRIDWSHVLHLGSSIWTDDESAVVPSPSIRGGPEGTDPGEYAPVLVGVENE